jgi:flagellar protein FliO/FliZ
MWRVIATFIAVALIIYLSYIASKYIGRGLKKSGSSRYMRLLDQVTLGQDRHVAIVQVGAKYLLVGVTAGQISFLSELRDEELVPLSAEEEDMEMKTPDFRNMLEKLSELGKRGGKDS